MRCACCAGSNLKNEPLNRWAPKAGYATAFSYGVLEQLRDTRVVIAGNRRRLLDEVDIISGVSGGSFPAAYYALYGEWIFLDFEARFLKSDIQGALVGRLLNPKNGARQFSPFFGRWEIAAEYYDEALFHGATFGDRMSIRGRSR